MRTSRLACLLLCFVHSGCSPSSADLAALIDVVWVFVVPTIAATLMSLVAFLSLRGRAHVPVAVARVIALVLAILVPVLVLWSTRDCAFRLASRIGYARLVSALLQTDLDIDSRDTAGHTALIRAAGKGHTDVVRVLLAAGANVNQYYPSSMVEESHDQWFDTVHDPRSVTALMHASGEGHLEIVSLLIRAGAHVNTTTNQGTSALMYASNRGRTEVVRALLAAGADVHQSAFLDATPRKHNALSAAESNGFIDIVAALKDAGARMP